jgi:hypothetical protein
VADGVLHPVLAVRDPVEIALSQARRGGTTPAHALASWEVQVAAVLDWLQGRTVTVAPYVELLKRPQTAIDVVASASVHLLPERRRGVDPEGAAGALDPSQRNEAIEGRAHEEYLTSKQRQLWMFLRSLPAGDVEIEAPAALRKPSAAAVAAVEKECELIDFAAEHERVAALLKEAGEHGAKAAEELARLVPEAALNRERAAGLEAELERTHHRLGTAEAGIATIRSSLSWRITKPLRLLRRGTKRRL